MIEGVVIEVLERMRGLEKERFKEDE